MRKIVAYCELCYGADEILTEATATEAVSLRGNDYVMDLCDEHQKLWFAPFADVVTEHGMRAADVERDSSRKLSKVKVAKPPEYTGKMGCIKPDCSFRFNDRATMRQHVIDDHMEWLKFERPDILPEPCTIDGCDTICFGNRGLVQHVRQGHPDQYDEWKASLNGSNENTQALLPAHA